MQEMVKILHPFCIRLQRKRCFFFAPPPPPKQEEGGKKLRAAICRPWDVFLLDSPGPRLAPALPPTARGWPCGHGSAQCLPLLPGPLHTRPPLGAQASPSRQGGRLGAGRQRCPRRPQLPGTALLCACLLCQPPLQPPTPTRPAPGPGRRACCPQSSHPAPTWGALTFWAPGSWPQVLLVPRSPGPVLRALRSPHPAARARRRAWHRARLPGSPARAGRTFRRGCVWGGSCGVRVVPGEGEGPRCLVAGPRPPAPSPRPACGGLPCLLSPESHRGADNMSA